MFNTKVLCMLSLVFVRVRRSQAINVKLISGSIQTQMNKAQWLIITLLNRFFQLWLITQVTPTCKGYTSALLLVNSHIFTLHFHLFWSMNQWVMLWSNLLGQRSVPRKEEIYPHSLVWSWIYCKSSSYQVCWSRGSESSPHMSVLIWEQSFCTVLLVRPQY